MESDDFMAVNRLYYICRWGKNPRKAWSGTYYKLFEALSKSCKTDGIIVRDINIKETFISRLRLFLSKRISAIPYTFAYEDVVSATKSVNRVIMREPGVAFAFTEMDYCEDIKSFIYQDMCVEYIAKVIYKTPELYNNYNPRNISKRIMNKRILKQREYYSKCAGVFVMGDWLRDYMINVMGIDAGKIHTVGAGIDIDISKIKYSASKNHNKILFVGVDFARKGGYQLLEAFKLVRDTNPDAELYIAGPSEQPFAENIEGVKFLGRLSSEELINYYSICDIFCMPSYIEPFGKVFVEALSCGLPCIGRDSFAMPEIIREGKNGLLVKSDDASELADKINTVLTDASFTEYAYEHMNYYQKAYSWDTIAENIINIINKVE